MSPRSELEEDEELLEEELLLELEDDELLLELEDDELLLELEDDDEEPLDVELEDDVLELDVADDDEPEEGTSGPVPLSVEQPASIPTPARATLPERIFRNSRRRSLSAPSSCGIEVLSAMGSPSACDTSKLRAGESASHPRHHEASLLRGRKDCADRPRTVRYSGARTPPS